MTSYIYFIVFARDEGTGLATRPEGVEAEGLALPCRHGAHGRAAGVGPARLMQRGLQRCPVTLAVTHKDHLRSLGHHLASQLDQGDMEVFRKVALRGLSYPPGQRQGASFIDDMHHQCRTPAAYATAIHDEHHRLQGEMTQQDVHIGQKYISSRMWALSHHRAKRLTRLSGVLPWGTYVLLGERNHNLVHVHPLRDGCCGHGTASCTETITIDGVCRPGSDTVMCPWFACTCASTPLVTAGRVLQRVRKTNPPQSACRTWGRCTGRGEHESSGFLRFL